MPVRKSAVHSSRSSQPDEVLFSEKPVQHSHRYDPETKTYLLLSRDSGVMK